MSMVSVKCVFCGAQTWTGADDRLVAHLQPTAHTEGIKACKEGKWVLNVKPEEEAPSAPGPMSPTAVELFDCAGAPCGTHDGAYLPDDLKWAQAAVINDTAYPAGWYCADCLEDRGDEEEAQEAIRNGG